MYLRRLLFVGISIFCAAIVLISLLFLIKLPQAQATGSTRYVSFSGDCGSALPCYSTIQAAVDSASNGDLIKVAQGTYTSTALEVVFINKSIELIGGFSTGNWNQPYPITQTTVVDGVNVRRGFMIDGTTVPTITLSNLTVQHAFQNTDGAGIYVISGTIQLKNVSVLTNTVGTMPDRKGGGLYMPHGTLLVEGSLFKGNTSHDGGGIYASGDSITIKTSKFEGNLAIFSGGGAYLRGKMVEISNTKFLDNISTGGGGGCEIQYSPSVTIVGNEFQRNHGYTGGLLISSISPSGTTITVSNNLFQNNIGNIGGGAQIVALTITVNANTFIQNTGFNGGGLYLRGVSIGPPGDPINNVFYPVHIEHNSFISNIAQEGGGLYINEGHINLDNNSFRGNAARSTGGALCINTNMMGMIPPIVTSSGNEFIANSLLIPSSAQLSILGGGSIFLGGGSLHSQNDVVAQTKTSTQAILISDGSFKALHATLVDNGNFALTTSGGTASLTDTVIMSHTAGGLAGINIFSDHNLFFNSGTPCMSGAVCNSNIVGNPKLINPLTNDYHLASDSSAIDRGVNSHVGSDFDGNLRPRGCGFDLGAFEYQAKNCTISSTGGILQGLHYTLIFPAGIFTDTVVITHTVLALPSLPTLPKLRFGMDNQFELTATYKNTGEPVVPTGTYTLTAEYDISNLMGTPEGDLGLYFWNNNKWSQEPGEVLDLIDKTITVFPDHFSIWAVLGKLKAYISLPIVIK